MLLLLLLKSIVKMNQLQLDSYQGKYHVECFLFATWWDYWLQTALQIERMVVWRFHAD